MNMYICNKCGGKSSTSNCCENPDCPNMPCCGKTKENCNCNLKNKNHVNR